MTIKTCEKCGATWDGDQSPKYKHACPPSKEGKESDENADMSEENSDGENDEV